MCKQHNILVFDELETNSDRVIAIKACDPKWCISTSANLYVYKPFYQRGNVDLTEAFLDTIDTFQALVDIYCPSTWHGVNSIPEFGLTINSGIGIDYLKNGIGIEFFELELIVF